MAGIEDVRLQPLHKKFARSLLFHLLIVLLLSLAILVPVETYHFKKTAQERLESLKTRVRERLISIANTTAMQISGDDHVEIFAKGDESFPQFVKIREILREVQRRNQLKEEIYTLRLEDQESRLAKFVIMSGEEPYVGVGYTFPKEMLTTFLQARPSSTDIYLSKSIEGGRWMSAFAPISEPDSPYPAVLEVDISVEHLLQKYELEMENLKDIQNVRSAGLVGVFMLIYSLIFFSVRRNLDRHVDEPVEEMMNFAKRVRDGNYTTSLLLRGGDELEVLANSLNEMVDGLRERQAMSHFLTGMELQEVQAVSGGSKSLAAGGSKKNCTILFSDIRSFTTICENEDPSNIVRALNLYFDQMIPLIEKYGGSLDKLIGDAVMAVFEEREGYSDSDSALMSAIEMQQVLPELRESMKAEGLPEFYVGFGINSGESVLGNLGTQNQLSRTVLGDAVNLAARVESLSKEGKDSKILFTEFTRERLQSSYENDFLMETIVKGKSKPVKIYEISFSRMFQDEFEL